MRQAFLFYAGDRYLTEAIAETEVEARGKVMDDTAVACAVAGTGHTPYEWKRLLVRATVKTLPLPVPSKYEGEGSCYDGDVRDSGYYDRMVPDTVNMRPLLDALRPPTTKVTWSE